MNESPFWKACAACERCLEHGDPDVGWKRTTEGLSLCSGCARPWRVRLTCCGRDEGFSDFETWEEADALRESYLTSDPFFFGNHDRSAIIVRAGETEPTND